MKKENSNIGSASRVHTLRHHHRIYGSAGLC